jgi:UDP-N-acetylmuramyl pentapeptide phosphotransferase/UDP-N-acetylglucosamine-1-phosphate transferase
MVELLISFFTSLGINGLIIRTQRLHGSYTADSQLNGPQKFHTKLTPRIGGLGISIALFISFISHQNTPEAIEGLVALLCALPVLGIGIAEDISKKISVRTRLIFTASGAFLFTYLFTSIQSLDIPVLDSLLLFPIVAISLTIFAITGIANAYNIIDGFNGLASMVSIISLLALGYMGILFDDRLIMLLSITMTGAVLGFFILNYPNGLIFLGDGGAYLIGFWIAILSILLCARHPEISPWFALILNAYPILETLFTIYRRKFHQNKSPGHPDGIHFHSLIYRRILNRAHQLSKNNLLSANAKTSPYLWILSSLSVIPAVLFWHSTSILIGFIVMFTATYVWLYKKIVSFKTPKWLHLI